MIFQDKSDVFRSKNVVITSENSEFSAFEVFSAQFFNAFVGISIYSVQRRRQSPVKDAFFSEP